MKRSTLFYLTIGLIFLIGCNQKTDTNAMLQNRETRNEIFDVIANNHNYMSEFMEEMQSNNHAMKMMKDGKMMGHMMKENGMQMMMKDSTMKHNMMQSMMKDGKMMGHMMKMMHKEGMMNEECMQSCMKMMGDKGMKMDSIPKDEKGNNHDSHNH